MPLNRDAYVNVTTKPKLMICISIHRQYVHISSHSLLIKNHYKKAISFRIATVGKILDKMEEVNVKKDKTGVKTDNSVST
jgi:hypothetical protein